METPHYHIWCCIKCCFICMLSVCSITATKDGKDGVVALAHGDMRKALNILQVKYVFLSLSTPNYLCLIRDIIPFILLVSLQSQKNLPHATAEM